MRRQSGDGAATPQRTPPARSAPQQQPQRSLVLSQQHEAWRAAAGSCSRALWRQAEKFAEAEARGSAPLGACAAQLERAALVRR